MPSSSSGQPPLIFDIVRGSLVDGPGIRTVAFLKGCPLRCVWCHNPEGQTATQQIAFYPADCTGCGGCLAACEKGAIDLGAESRIDRARCLACGACAQECDSEALRAVGRAYSVDELVEICLRDQVYFETSGGGVTFSGGEPLAHMGYLEEVVEELTAHGIHVAVETCGDFDLNTFTRFLASSVDLLLFDLKLHDPVSHRRHTGRGNERILRNLEALVQAGRPRLQVRVPLVPAITAEEENLWAIADHLRDLGIGQCTLLSYNPPGLGKWRNLAKEVPVGVSDRPLTMDDETRLRNGFEERLRAESAASQW